jgi:predicted site-specific integrase-resolvase
MLHSFATAEGNMSAQAITPRLLNFKQASEYLGCSVWQLRQFEWNGVLPSVRGMGKKILFDIEDLNRLVEQKKCQGRA